MDQQLKGVRAGVDVVIATPGRLIDLRQRGEIDLGQIEVVVLDEADRMADMGFTPQVEWLLRHLVRRTPDHALLGHPRRRRRPPGPLRANRSCAPRGASSRATVTEMAPPFHPGAPDGQGEGGGDDLRPLRALHRLCPHQKRGRQADRGPAHEGVNARAIHGDLRQQARERALRGFSEGRLPVLVATDVAARGLDVDGIDVVIHFDPPEDHKSYLHRSGRTARAGREGLVVTLVLWNEHLEMERIQKRLGIVRSDRRDVLQRPEVDPPQPLGTGSVVSRVTMVA